MGTKTGPPSPRKIAGRTGPQFSFDCLQNAPGSFEPVHQKVSRKLAAAHFVVRSGLLGSNSIFSENRWPHSIPVFSRGEIEFRRVSMSGRDKFGERRFDGNTFGWSWFPSTHDEPGAAAAVGINTATKKRPAEIRRAVLKFCHAAGYAL